MALSWWVDKHQQQLIVADNVVMRSVEPTGDELACDAASAVERRGDEEGKAEAYLIKLKVDLGREVDSFN